MAVDVLFFAQAAGWVGVRRLSLPPAPTVGALLERPELSPLRGRHALRFSVNHDFAELSSSLKDGDEVAVLPPVSGG